MREKDGRMERLVSGSEKITSIFGYWPTFHDAEVIELKLWRGDVNPDNNKYVFPVLTTRIHVFEMTSEVNSEGCYMIRHHTLATLRFHDIEELKIEDFNHQNAIYGLSLKAEERGEDLPPYVLVEFEPSFGIGASFRCSRAEVVEAVPCDANGEPSA